MLSAQHSPLVSGAAPEAGGSTQAVRVVRAFMLAGERVEPGAVVSVPALLARELAVWGKAVPHGTADPDAAATEPPQPQRRPAVKRAPAAASTKDPDHAEQ